MSFRRGSVRLVLLASMVLATFPVGRPALASAAHTTTGTLNIYVVGEGSPESHVAFVTTDRGEIPVPVGQLPHGALTGDKVSVEVQGDNVLSVRLTSGRVRAATVPDGVRKALVIITSTTSPIASPTSSPAEVAEVMGQVDELYKMTSNNRVSFTADVVTATIASAGCKTFTENVKNAKAAAGVDASKYQHIIVLVPDISCGFAGLGSLGGGSVMVVSPSFNKLVVSHEIGHNLGLQHAASVHCGNESNPVAIVTDWVNTCTKSEYGDWYSPMGAAHARSFPALQLMQLGWIDRSQISTATTGTVELSPLSGTTGTRALVLPDMGGRGVYWLEYRTPVGADADIRDSNQVQVRFQAKESNVWDGVDSVVLNASGAWTYRWSVPGMTKAGQVFTDATGQLSVTVVSVGATATVSVTMTGSPPSLDPVGLKAEFNGNNLEYSFSAPASGFRVDGYDATISDGSRVLDTVSLPGTGDYQFDSVRPGPFTLTVTTKTPFGTTGSASLQMVAPDITLQRVNVTSAPGGANVVFSLSSDSASPVTYTVVATRPGYSKRVVTTSSNYHELWGLASGGQWTLKVTATVNGYTTAAITKTFRPLRGGMEVGKIRKHTVKKSAPNAARAVTVVVPAQYRYCWGACSPRRLVGEFVQPNGTAKKTSISIPRNGRVVLVFSAKTTAIRLKLGYYSLAPVSLTK